MSPSACSFGRASMPHDSDGNGFKPGYYARAQSSLWLDYDPGSPTGLIIGISAVAVALTSCAVVNPRIAPRRSKSRQHNRHIRDDPRHLSALSRQNFTVGGFARSSATVNVSIGL